MTNSSHFIKIPHVILIVFPPSCWETYSASCLLNHIQLISSESIVNESIEKSSCPLLPFQWRWRRRERKLPWLTTLRVIMFRTPRRMLFLESKPYETTSWLRRLWLRRRSPSAHWSVFLWAAHQVLESTVTFCCVSSLHFFAMCNLLDTMLMLAS